MILDNTDENKCPKCNNTKNLKIIDVFPSHYIMCCRKCKTYFNIHHEGTEAGHKQNEA